MKIIALLISFVLLSSALADPGLPKTESTLVNTTIQGTGYIVATKKTGDGICQHALSPLYNNCRYFVVTTAHHFYGENKMVCSAPDQCFEILEKDGGQEIVIDHSRDIAVAELVKKVGLVPFAHLSKGKLQLLTGTVNRPVSDDILGSFYHFDTRTTFKALMVGDSADSKAWNIQPFVPFPNWISSKPKAYKLMTLPIMKGNINDVIHAKRLAISNNWVLPSQIRPGMSGSPMIGPSTNGSFHQSIIGHTLSYNRYTSESVFLNSDVIIELIRKLSRGKSKSKQKLLGREVTRVFNPKLGVSYRKLVGIETHELAWKSTVAGEEKAITIEGGGTYGDGGDNKSFESNKLLLPGIILDGERVIGFQMDKKRWGNASFTISADWNAINLIDKYKKKYSFTSILPGTNLFEKLKKRLTVNSKSCKTVQSCKTQRGVTLCASLELKMGSTSLSFGKKGNKLHKVVINKFGSSQGKAAYNPVLLYEESGEKFYIDYTGLFSIDLMSLYKERSEKNEIDSLKRVYSKGPRIRISIFDEDKNVASFPTDLIFESCK